MKLLTIDECEIFLGQTRNGYGVVRIGRNSFFAHRLAFEKRYGSIPDGKHVCHACDNRLCINVNHLFLGSHAENMRDMKHKGRAAHGQKNAKARLAENQIRRIHVLRASGESLNALAVRYGVSRPTISKILLGSSYKMESQNAKQDIREAVRRYHAGFEI